MAETPTFGRYAEIPYDQMTPEQQETYRSLIETRGRLPGPNKIYVHNPKLAKVMGPLGAYFRTGYSLTEREREIAVCVITSKWHAAYRLCPKRLDFPGLLSQPIGLPRKARGGTSGSVSSMVVSSISTNWCLELRFGADEHPNRSHSTSVPGRTRKCAWEISGGELLPTPCVEGLRAQRRNQCTGYRFCHVV